MSIIRSDSKPKVQRSGATGFPSSNERLWFNHARYDGVNRLTSKSYNDGQTPSVQYTYDVDERETGDTAPNYPIGRLSQVRTPATGTIASATTYTHYDPLGRVIGSRQDTAGQPYDFLYTYSDVALETTTYPSKRVVESCYDAAGRIQSLQNIPQTGSATPYASGVQYDPGGGVKQMTLGNNLVETRSYNSRLQVTEIKTGTAQTPNLLTLDYNYGTTTNNGNLQTQTITRTTNGAAQVWTQSYGYL